MSILYNVQFRPENFFLCFIAIASLKIDFISGNDRTKSLLSVLSRVSCELCYVLYICCEWLCQQIHFYQSQLFSYSVCEANSS